MKLNRDSDLDIWKLGMTALMKGDRLKIKIGGLSKLADTVIKDNNLYLRILIGDEEVLVLAKEGWEANWDDGE